MYLINQENPTASFNETSLKKHFLKFWVELGLVVRKRILRRKKSNKKNYVYMYLSVLKWEYYQHMVLFSLEHVNVVMRLTLIIISYRDRPAEIFQRLC